MKMVGAGLERTQAHDAGLPARDDLLDLQIGGIEFLGQGIGR